eukprot:scaffold201_cov405-Prasinococcus_capsulatus_cf.AAC.12
MPATPAVDKLVQAVPAINSTSSGREPHGSDTGLARPGECMQNTYVVGSIFIMCPSLASVPTRGGARALASTPSSARRAVPFPARTFKVETGGNTLPRED